MSACGRASDARKRFGSIVQHEVRARVAAGESKEAAVKQLLGIICRDSAAPPAGKVKKVMRAQNLSHLDATHAIIVANEIGRLRRRGFDPVSAIDELTAKLQRASTTSPPRSPRRVSAPAAASVAPATSKHVPVAAECSASVAAERPPRRSSTVVRRKRDLPAALSPPSKKLKQQGRAVEKLQDGATGTQRSKRKCKVATDVDVSLAACPPDSKKSKRLVGQRKVAAEADSGAQLVERHDI